jgi:ribosomal protein L6P/L9E
VFGVSFWEVNQFAALLVSFRFPDVYKNKGVQIVGSTFRLKAGKQK